MSELRRRILLASALMLLALGLLVIERAGYLDPLKSAAARPLLGLQRSFSTAYYNVRDFLTAPRNLAELRGENAQLQSHVSQLEAEVVPREPELGLRALLGFARASRPTATRRRVIGRDTALSRATSCRLWIRGAKRGMPVVARTGWSGAFGPPALEGAAGHRSATPSMPGCRKRAPRVPIGSPRAS
jgi:hypothetical protein